MITPQDLKNALRKAKRDYNRGTRYYDTKHNTFHPASYVENILENVSDIVGLHGIEAYHPGESNPSNPKYLYINSGDSYGLTVVYNRKSDVFLVGSIGNIIEREEPSTWE